MKRLGFLGFFGVMALTGSLGCAGNNRYIGGTQIPDSEANREIIATVEKYRTAVERKDTPTLLTLASRNYWEDGGTPTGADDYGYDGLREVLTSRFQRAENIRYSMRYMGVEKKGNRAFVDVLIDASYSFMTERGPTRMDKRDQNRIVLEQQDGRWLFVSGM